MVLGRRNKKEEEEKETINMEAEVARFNTFAAEVNKALEVLNDRLVEQLNNVASEVKNSKSYSESFQSNIGARIAKVEKQVVATQQRIKDTQEAPTRPTATVPIIGDPTRWIRLCEHGTYARLQRTEAYEVSGLGVIVRCLDGERLALTFVPGARLMGREGDKRIEKLP